jgi:hypothetical protein
MSVAPAWRDLPPWRIPRRLVALAADASGKDDDVCWCMGEGPFEAGIVEQGLVLRPDRPSHGLVEPAEPMQVDEYQARLAATRQLWRIDED